MALTKVSTGVVDMSGNTGGLVIAKGTEAQRPASPSIGMIRESTETTPSKVEVYTDNSSSPGWRFLEEGGNAIVLPLNIEYLIVAGGGAGGNGMGAGGGAGGLIHNYNGTALSLTAGTPYQVTIGDGATGTTSNQTVNGSDSVFNTLTAIGGGGGSSLQMQRSGGTKNGANGGSGGGSGASDGNNAPYPGYGYGGIAAQPSSASGGYGNAGGAPAVKTYYPGGGGGGAGAVGQTPASPTSPGGAGGAGLQVNIDGNNYYWAAGGGGVGYNSGSAGAGGIGGGGGGSCTGNSPAVSGAGGGSSINAGSAGIASPDSIGGAGGANTGSGGGGASWSNNAGGNGGSGIVILRYPGGYSANQSGGLTTTTAVLSNERVTTITAGSGTITFALI